MMDKQNAFITKWGATLVLKLALLVIGVIVLLLSVFALPSIWKGGSAEFPEASISVFLIVIGLYATTVPFFIGLWQTFKLLRYIDKNQTFSDLSVQALEKIKYCALVIGILYMGGLPLLYPIADADDAPGLLVFGFIFACIPIVVAVFAELLEKIVQDTLKTNRTP